MRKALCGTLSEPCFPGVSFCYVSVSPLRVARSRPPQARAPISGCCSRMIWIVSRISYFSSATLTRTKRRAHNGGTQQRHTSQCSHPCGRALGMFQAQRGPCAYERHLLWFRHRKHLVLCGFRKRSLPHAKVLDRRFDFSGQPIMPGHQHFWSFHSAMCRQNPRPLRELRAE